MQLSSVVEPFGEVNVEKLSNGELQVKATILLVPDIEFDGMGLALDASASMQKMYGISGIVSNVFAQASNTPNVVEPVARTMVKYLSTFSPKGVNSIYWACGSDGSQIMEIGEFNGKVNGIDLPDINTITISGPSKKIPMGRETKLLPPLKYFIERFKDSSKRGVKQPAAICLFITDGRIDDLKEVKQFCFQYAQDIAQKQKPFIKLFLIGVGEAVDQEQMTELDDMFEGKNIQDHEGQNIDLWDHQLAEDFSNLEKVFKELISEDLIVVPSGKISNQAGAVAKDYPDGVPAMLRFTLPQGSTEFTLEFPGGKVTQNLSEALSQP